MCNYNLSGIDNAINIYGLIIGVAGAVLGIFSFAIARMGDARKMENRLTSIEGDIKAIRVKIDPIWNAITSEFPKLIIREDTPEIDTLLRKFMIKTSPLNPNENQRLIELLDEEQQKAIETGDAGRGLTIVMIKGTIASQHEAP